MATQENKKVIWLTASKLIKLIKVNLHYKIHITYNYICNLTYNSLRLNVKIFKANLVVELSVWSKSYKEYASAASLLYFFLSLYVTIQQLCTCAALLGRPQNNVYKTPAVVLH